MALTAAQMEARAGKLTASAIACLMTGNETKIMDLWRELIGDPDFVRVDLSGVWPVQLGSTTEELNLDWYARKKNCNVTRRGEVAVHPDYPWAAATLDGWDDVLCIPVETKHVGGREARDVVLHRYMPQLHWQMFVTGTKRIGFSVIEAANAPLVDYITYDEDYGAELFRRAVAFMACVDSMTPPFEQAAPTAPPPQRRGAAPTPPPVFDAPGIAAPGIADVPAPPPAKVFVEYDMAGKNEWAAHAATWLADSAAAKRADKAEVDLKALMPEDAKRSHGFGVEITRDRGGKLKLKKMEA